MDFSDVDRVLDRRIVIGYTGSLPVSTFSRKVDFPFQSGLHFGESELDLSYFIPEELAESREIAIFIAKTNAQRHGSLFLINYTLSHPMLFSALNSVWSSSHSTVMDSLMLYNGDYHLSLRFNSNEMKEISDILLKFSGEIPGLSVNYLGSSGGFSSILKEVCDTTKLVRFEWEVTLPKDALNLDPFRILGDEWVSEVRFMTKSHLVSELIRTKLPLAEPKKNGLTVVSEKDNLYEFGFRSDRSLISDFHTRAYDSRLLRFGRELHFKDGTLKIANVIPKVQTDEMINILTKSKAAYPEWDLTLSKIEDP